MAERPQVDPPTDSLTTLAEAERDAALRRFEALRPHLQDGVALTEAATAANVPVRFCRSRLPSRRWSATSFASAGARAGAHGS